jgi:hypothetical protein
MCHLEDDLSVKGLSRWLGSFSELVGIVLIREEGNRNKQRIRAEIRRSGYLRFFFDILPYRIYSKIVHARLERAWSLAKIEQLVKEFPEIQDKCERLICASPNDGEVRQFLERLAPDVMFARCKTLIDKKVFSTPGHGTLIAHPGICPEYRNSHGCFWALANDDFDRVGATLIKIDDGIDTGPIFGFYSYPYDALHETPNVIQLRVVYENLDAIRGKIVEIYEGKAAAILIDQRTSNVWGQPWLSKYIHIKNRARNR